MLHDLAVLRPVQPPAEGVPALALRPPGHPLAQGERIYSLGNPLDVGFAITEGTYNGLVQRSFYPRIFFGGALNPGNMIFNKKRPPQRGLFICSKVINNSR